MPNVIIEVRTTCPTCVGSGFYEGAGYNEGDRFTCTSCHGTGTVVDAERSQWLRAVAEWAADDEGFWQVKNGLPWCPSCDCFNGHAPDCPHVLAKLVMA